MSDQEILEQLRSRSRQEGLTRLYQYLPKVEQLIVSNGGSKIDAQDVFQEALIVLIKKAAQPDFTLTASVDTYLYSVCKFIWNNELRKRGKSRESELPSEIDDTAEQELGAYLEKESRIKQVEMVLRALGKRCQQVLVLFYYKAMSMVDIAKQMGLSSENSAKTQKYKCLEQAKLKLKAQRA